MLVLVQNSKRFRSVEILLDGEVAVANCSIRNSVDMVNVAEPIVFEIMADSCPDDGQYIYGVKLSSLNNSSICEH